MARDFENLYTIHSQRVKKWKNIKIAPNSKERFVLD